MKKIISIVLVLTCLLALASCDLFGGSNGAFQTAIDNTNPKDIIVDASVETELGDLTSSFEIHFNDDGSAVIEYTTEKFNKIGEGDGELKSTIAGTITKAADGTYSGDTEAVDVSGIVAGAKIDVSAMKDYTVNEAGDVLTANVAAADTAAVLGSALSYDVVVKISLAGDAIEYIDITFDGGFIKYSYK